MQRKAVLGFVGALACALALVSAPNASADRSSADLGSAGARSGGLIAIGLTSDQKLVRFNVDTPRATRPIAPISGLAGDTTAVATKVSQLSVALTGTNFGVDFNPAADNDLDPNTATTLFDLDASLDQIAVQAPANSGQLSATGKLTVDAGASDCFDIHSALSNGGTVDASGFATIQASGTYRLYAINLLTGRATEGGLPPQRPRV